MRMLHITPQAPAMKSGGGIGIYQTMYSITSIADEVDYVGPEIEDAEIKSRYSKLYELHKSDNLFELLYTLANFQINKRFYSWRKQNIDFSTYDAFIIDFTKQDYVIKDIVKKVNNKKIIVRVHNVEYDYSKADFHSNKTLNKYIVHLLSRKNEKYMLKKASNVVVLTSNDKERIEELYNIDPQKMSIIPVSVGHIDVKSKCRENMAKTKILVTGSLWFGPNAEGIYWLIDNVLSNLSEKFEVIVAGHNPSEKMKIKCKEQDIKLIESPETMAPIFSETDIVAVPIFDGAGMKVKIAEAMSYGKFVISTSYGLVGYEKSNEGIFAYADTPEEFIKAFEWYEEMEYAEKQRLKKKILSEYQSKYSLEASICRFQEIINDII